MRFECYTGQCRTIGQRRDTAKTLKMHFPVLILAYENAIVLRALYLYPTKKETHTLKLIIFLIYRKCYTSLNYIILKACHRLLHFTSFVSRRQKCRQESCFSICKVTKNGVFVMLTLSMKVSSGNRLYKPLSEPPHDKTHQSGMCAQRRLRSAWPSAQSDQSSLSALRKLGSLATHWAHREDSDQTGRMPRLIWVFAGRTLILLVLSRGVSSSKYSLSHLWSRQWSIGCWGVLVVRLSYGIDYILEINFTNIKTFKNGSCTCKRRHR